MKKSLIIISLFLYFSIAFGWQMPDKGNFEIKEISDKNVLYTVHTDDKGHVSNTLVKLVQ